MNIHSLQQALRERDEAREALKNETASFSACADRLHAAMLDVEDLAQKRHDLETRLSDALALLRRRQHTLTKRHATVGLTEEEHAEWYAVGTFISRVDVPPCEHGIGPNGTFDGGIPCDCDPCQIRRVDAKGGE